MMVNLCQKGVELERNESEIQLRSPSFKMSETSWEVVRNNLTLEEQANFLSGELDSDEALHACDLSTHEALVLHNRASMVEGFFRHLPPSTFVQQHEGGKFSYHEKGGNKQRHQLRRKIAVEKKALEVAINEHNAAVGEVEKLPPPNELLAVDNYSWPWECKYFL
ncbi:hypothetical protein D9C73_025281 [Collichthys lucidus]|uniref:Uncharacterized protein n=1 Tax=Collichthys lucidus TaxID=240159 RepID=A0A4U5VRA0_COLLU|nr:hypothetical protein D9C73_025281 [Collichthys lucidus]